MPLGHNAPQQGQLPVETTGFVGREAELARLSTLLEHARLITVTGPGGVWVFDRHGDHLGTVNLIEHPANFAWGDANFSTLYFCGRASLYKLKMKVRGFIPYVAYAKQGAP